MKFLRRLAWRESKLGKNRKKKQIWRRASGRHNKMRQKMRGYSQIVEVGHRTATKDRNKILGEEISKISNTKELSKIKSGKTIIIGKVGTKRKLEIMKAAKEKGINVHMTNIDKFIKKNERSSVKNESKKEKAAS